MTQYEKMVYLPIIVTRGDHCWGPEPNYVICRHFDNENGHPRCSLNLGLLKYTQERCGKDSWSFKYTVLKPSECYELRQFQEEGK
jgi:hypothetical protein